MDTPLTDTTDTHMLPTTTARGPPMLNQRLMLMLTMDITDMLDHTLTEPTAMATDTHTDTDTTERGPLMPRLRPTPPSSTTPMDTVPSVPTPTVLEPTPDTEPPSSPTEVSPPPTTLSCAPTTSVLRSHARRSALVSTWILLSRL